MRPRLQPEDLRRNIAALSCTKQRAGDRRIGLRHTAIELITKAPAQSLRGVELQKELERLAPLLIRRSREVMASYPSSLFC